MVKLIGRLMGARKPGASEKPDFRNIWGKRIMRISCIR